MWRYRCFLCLVILWTLLGTQGAFFLPLVLQHKFLISVQSMNFSVIENSPSEWLSTQVMDSFIFKDVFYQIVLENLPPPLRIFFVYWLILDFCLANWLSDIFNNVSKVVFSVLPNTVRKLASTFKNIFCVLVNIGSLLAKLTFRHFQ